LKIYINPGLNPGRYPITIQGLGGDNKIRECSVFLDVLDRKYISYTNGSYAVQITWPNGTTTTTVHQTYISDKKITVGNATTSQTTNIPAYTPIPSNPTDYYVIMDTSNGTYSGFSTGNSVTFTPTPIATYGSGAANAGGGVTSYTPTHSATVTSYTPRYSNVPTYSSSGAANAGSSVALSSFQRHDAALLWQVL
jgi:hypothetical protein